MGARCLDMDLTKEQVRALYDITDWGLTEIFMYMTTDNTLEEREEFWNEYNERIIEWAVNLKESI